MIRFLRTSAPVFVAGVVVGLGLGATAAAASLVWDGGPASAFVVDSKLQIGVRPNSSVFVYCVTPAGDPRPDLPPSVGGNGLSAFADGAQAVVTLMSCPA